MVTWFVKQCYSDQRSLTPPKYSVCIEVILGLSQQLYDKTIRVSRGCKSNNPDLGEYSNMLAKLTITSLPLHKHLHLTILHMIIMQVNTKSPRLAIFILSHKVFFLQAWLVFGIFSSPRFYFSASHSNSPIVGASDIGQESAYSCKL